MLACIEPSVQLALAVALEVKGPMTFRRIRANGQHQCRGCAEVWTVVGNDRTGACVCFCIDLNTALNKAATTVVAMKGVGLMFNVERRVCIMGSRRRKILDSVGAEMVAMALLCIINGIIF